jgi:hypothetical protein
MPNHGGVNCWPPLPYGVPNLGPASLVLFDVSTLYFETDAGDGFREPGFSNYAELAVMPRSWWLWWRWCCSAVLVGVARAA